MPPEVSVVEGAVDQLRAEALVAHRRLDLRVWEDHSVAMGPVLGEPDETAVEAQPNRVWGALLRTSVELLSASGMLVPRPGGLSAYRVPAVRDRRRRAR